MTKKPKPKKKVRYNTQTVYQKAGKHTTMTSKGGKTTIYKERGP